MNAKMAAKRASPGGKKPKSPPKAPRRKIVSNGPAYYTVSDGTVRPGPKPRRIPALLEASLSGSRLKVKAARYFLDLLKRDLNDVAATLYHADAFLSALRATTWILKKEASKSPGFASWYAIKEEEMKRDPLLNWTRDLRNEAQKEGLQIRFFGIKYVARRHLDGRVSSKAEVKAMAFVDLQRLQPLQDFEEALSKLEAIIEEAHQCGFVPSSTWGKNPEVMFIVEPHEQEMPDGTWAPVFWGHNPLFDLTMDPALGTGGKFRPGKEWDGEDGPSP